MEFLLLIAFIFIIILLSRLRSAQKEAAADQQRQLANLRKAIEALKAEVGNINLQSAFQTQPAPPPLPVAPVPSAAPAEIMEQPLEEIVLPVVDDNIPEEVIATPKPLPLNPSHTPAPIAEPAESWWQKWMRNNPDLEKFVGENLVNKIGIAVLVLGIAFFVKYAIDKDWIKETGRVAIGIGCGIILVSIAHYLRNSYRSFSSVMAGGGIAVFYFTIAFAFHEYRMFGQTQAFTIMIVITIFAVLLSLLYNKIELAIIALLGGFLAPFLVSNGSGNYVALFSYLLVLNIGMLVIARFKQWPLLNVLAFLFTWVTFGGWLITFVFNAQVLPFKNAFLFATAFYIVFLVATLIHNLRTQKPFKAFDFSFLLAITFSYFAAGMYSLSDWNEGAYQGLFTISLGMINLVLAWFLFKTQKGDRNLLYLLIGLTLTFISLAAPVQLHGHSITLFWSAEAVLLYWLHQRSGMQIFKFSSALIVVLMLVSLLMDWSIANDRFGTNLVIIFNNWQGGITNIVAILSLAIYSRLLLKPSDQPDYLPGISRTNAGVLMAALASILLLVTCLFAVNLVFVQQQTLDIPNAYHQLLVYLFIAITLVWLQRGQHGNNMLLPMVLVLSAFVLYFFSAGYANNLVSGVVQQQYSMIHLVARWVAIAVLLYLAYLLICLVKLTRPEGGKQYTWMISGILLSLFSVECRLLYISLLSGPETIAVYRTQYARAGITIVWALFSFALMWLGMKHKYKPLRIISLAIFSLALLKLFVWDISNVSEGGKIAAFIMLGVLLLVISFMYQRLKKIIIDNEEKRD